jgi:hypothetical protein
VLILLAKIRKGHMLFKLKKLAISVKTIKVIRD